MRLACALDTQLVFYTAWNIFPTFPRIHLMSLPVSLSSIHTRILLRNSVGLMTLFFSVSLLPPLLCSDSHWSASQPQPCWSVSARSHDRRVQAPGVTVWPEGQWQCGGYLSGTDSPILPSCWTMRTPPPPPPSLPPSASLTHSTFLLLASLKVSRSARTVKGCKPERKDWLNWAVLLSKRAELLSLSSSWLEALLDEAICSFFFFIFNNIQTNIQAWFS